MKYRVRWQALVFSYQRFENALISIISIRPLTRITPILNFPILSQKRDLVGTFKGCLLWFTKLEGLVPWKSIFFLSGAGWQRLSKSFGSRIISNITCGIHAICLNALMVQAEIFFVYKQFWNKHNYTATPTCLLEQFDVFAKCHTKFDCLITEVFFIRIIRITIPQPTNWLCSCLSICVKNFLCQYANYGIVIDTSRPSTIPCRSFMSHVQGHCVIIDSLSTLKRCNAQT